jgi:cytochrome c oxidase subunit 2
MFCAEYCGTDHAQMTGWVIAMEPADYQIWLSGGAMESPASAGAQLIQQLGCNGCHRSDALGRAPVLEGVFGQPVQLEAGEVVIADESYLRESILDPQAKIVADYQPIMPSFRGQVSEEQLIRLIAYIKSLSHQTTPVPPVTTPGAGTAESPLP